MTQTDDMRVLSTIAEVRQAVAAARAAGRSIGLVPTMGALHAGHFSHLDAAQAAGDFVVVSIFVNPTQFGPTEDLAAYPRPLEADLAGCREHGAGLVFVPAVDEMYPDGAGGGLTVVHVRQLPDRLCGQSRPGHFDGVTTVVSKLLHIVQPDRAYFGAKYYQQATIIRRMVRDLDMPTEIVVGATVREADGLAMSSRNQYLTPEQRAQAPGLYAALQAGANLVRSAHPAAVEVIEAIRREIATRVPAGEIDYVQLVDPDSLEDVDATDRPTVALLAVRLGKARLIDNLRIEP